PIRPGLGVNLVLQLAEKHGPPLVRLGAVLAKRRLDGDEAPDPQQGHVLVVDAVERRVLAPRGEAVILAPIEQAQFERLDGLVVGLADDARCDPRRDVHPLAGAVHPYTDAIAPRRDDGIWPQPSIPGPVLPCLD